jgi:hypothetical protein
MPAGAGDQQQWSLIRLSGSVLSGTVSATPLGMGPKGTYVAVNESGSQAVRRLIQAQTHSSGPSR